MRPLKETTKDQTRSRTLMITASSFHLPEFGPKLTRQASFGIQRCCHELSQNESLQATPNIALPLHCSNPPCKQSCLVTAVIQTTELVERYRNCQSTCKAKRTASEGMVLQVLLAKFLVHLLLEVVHVDDMFVDITHVCCQHNGTKIAMKGLAKPLTASCSSASSFQTCNIFDYCQLNMLSAKQAQN